MIKRIFTICAFIVSGFMLAQTEETVVTTTTTTTTTTITKPLSSVRKNDVMINPIGLLAGAANISYEHHLNEEMGLGVSAFFIVEDYVIKEPDIWYVLPHYRYYMGRGWAKGFFIESFAGVVGKKYDIETKYAGNFGFIYSYERQWRTSFSAGVGFGGKWTTKKNLILEASLGLGRAFGVRDIDDDTPIFMKGMFGIGYRF